MDFRRKNFAYATKSFSQFAQEVAAGSRQYLRTLASDKPTQNAACLDKDFPELARDFRLPPELHFVRQNIHSSPLRISGPVNMWLHYDVGTFTARI